MKATIRLKRLPPESGWFGRPTYAYKQYKIVNMAQARAFEPGAWWVTWTPTGDERGKTGPFTTLKEIRAWIKWRENKTI